MPGFNGWAVARPVFRKNSGQFGQTRPVSGMAGLENEKEHALCQHSRVQPVTALMPMMAIFGRNADPSDTANYRLAA